MRCISFKVKGKLPPKKSLAISMWSSKSNDVPMVIALREKALAALDGQLPFSENIQLTLRVHVGEKSNYNPGDLDNFVSGVCDGLMAAHNNALKHVHESFRRPENRKIDPSKVIAIADDSQVTKIVAEKLYGDGGYWYEVEIRGE